MQCFVCCSTCFGKNDIRTAQGQRWPQWVGCRRREHVPGWAGWKATWEAYKGWGKQLPGAETVLHAGINPHPRAPPLFLSASKLGNHTGGVVIYGPHLISWADILHFWHFLPSFIVKNAPILQPTNCGCKFVFLFSSFSLLLPFSALFFLFSSASINLKASKLPTN